MRPAISATIAIGTAILSQVGAAVIFGAILLVAAAWFAGPARVARTSREAIAPFLRERPGASYAVTVGALVVLFIWDPIHATGTPAGMLVFTLMYAALASAWNIVGGYSGYISLGHAAFFGVGAYAIAIIFEHVSIGSGYRPFYVLPLVGIGVGLGSIPVAWVAYRTRAATFAIVTITLLFVAQQLAYNLHSLTGGSQQGNASRTAQVLAMHMRAC